MLDPQGDYTLLNVQDDNNNEKDDAAEKCLVTQNFPRFCHCAPVIPTLRRLKHYMRINSRLLVSSLICLILVLTFTFYNLFIFEIRFKNKMSWVNKNSKPTFLEKKIVHLDLKGAAPKPQYLLELFPFVKKLGFTGILMEYEDMFPYNAGLSVLSRRAAYSGNTIKQLKESANVIGLDIIPLIQTFGHLEFVLKHREFSSLREDPNWMDTICPSNERSIWLVREMLAQVRQIHPDEKAIHIGCDEAWHIGLDRACQLRLNTTLNGSTDRLKLEHISRIARMAKEEFAFEQIFAWNDMFDKVPVPLLKEYELGVLLIPVVWGYNMDVTQPDYFPIGLFERYSNVFEDIYFAGAFKGANGVTQQFVHIDRYMQNLRSYQKLYHRNEQSGEKLSDGKSAGGKRRRIIILLRYFMHLNNRLSGIILTGWQRFSHNKPLCELLPAAIPSLTREAIFLSKWVAGQRRPEEQKDDQQMREFLNCSALSPMSAADFVHKGVNYPFAFEFQFSECQFPGAELYREIERLNVLRWKAMIEQNVSGDVKKKGRNETTAKAKLDEEFVEARKRMASVLGLFFYEDTVNEWLAQHSHLSDFKDDDPNVRRFDPI